MRSAVSLVFGWVTDLWSGIVAATTELWNQVNGMVAVWVRWLELVINDARDFAQGLVSQAWDWTKGLFTAAWGYTQDVLHWAEGAVNDVRGWVTGLWDWLGTNVVRPLFAWINQAADFVWHIIDGWWQTIYADVIAPAFAVFSWAAHALSDIWGWLTGEAWSAVQLVVRAWDWLVWMGEHSFTDLIDIVHSARPFGTRSSAFVGEAEHAASLHLFGEYMDKVLS